MTFFHDLRFSWDRNCLSLGMQPSTPERAAFMWHRALPQHVWEAGALEKNPLTFPEVKTLLEGVTVGGHRLFHQDQILNLGVGAKRLLSLVRTRKFSLDKLTFCELQGVLAHNETLEWGHFRGEGAETRMTPQVALGKRERYTPSSTQPGAERLNRIFDIGLQALENGVSHPVERGAAFFLFGALQQFFFGGNKRTSRFMMNGLLMSHGFDAISISAARVQEFNTKMVDFYVTREGTDMMRFLLECQTGL